MLPDIASVIISASRRDSTDLPSLAIAPFHIASGEINVQDAEVLAQILAVEIVNTGRYAVLPRTSTMQAALDELQFQLTGATVEDEAKALGQAVNADYVLSAEVRSLGRLNMFTASILHVEDGSLLAGGFRNYQAITDGISLMAELAGSLAGGENAMAAAGVVTQPRPARERPAREPREQLAREPRERPVRKPLEAEAYRLHTLGVSAGTSFATPALIGTIHGTFSPFRSMFLEAGLDLGLIYRGANDSVDGYYSLYPFIHAGYFLPFATRAEGRGAGGFYIGAGAGFMLADYSFSDNTVDIHIFALNLTAGIIIRDFLNISYTLRTNFEGASNKIAVGYVFRFR